MTTEQEGYLALRANLRVVRKRSWWVTLAGLLGLAVGLGIALNSVRLYSATSYLLVQPTTALGLGQNPVSPTDVQTDIQLVTSAPVQQIVSRQLGYLPSAAVNEVNQTNVISITTTGRTPALAVRAANSYARAFAGYQQQVALNALSSAEAQLNHQIRIINRKIAALYKQKHAGARVGALTNEQAVERQQLSQMEVGGASGDLAGISFVAQARQPTSPSSPKPIEYGPLGLLGGLIVGIGLVFFRDNFDDTLTSKEVAEVTSGAPVLASVPLISSWKRKENPVVVSSSQPLSTAAESYRSLRTSIQFLRQDCGLRTLLVTSPAAAEGKTATVANLGVVFAQTGERVVMVSADLRHPRLGTYFDLSEEYGFTSVLHGQRTVAEVIQPVSGIDSLWLLGAGLVPGNPAELISSAEARDLFDLLRTEFDLVLLDSPPVLPVTDPVVLSKYADVVLMIAAASRTKRVAMKQATERLRHVNAAVAGVVINGVTRSSGSYGYEYYYGYGYGPRANGASPGSSSGGGPADLDRRRRTWHLLNSPGSNGAVDATDATFSASGPNGGESGAARHGRPR